MLFRSNALADDLVIASDHLPQLMEFEVPAKMSAAFVNTLPTRAIQGASVALPVRIQNVAPYVNAAGVDALLYSLACTGAVSGTSSGTAALSPASTTVNVNLNTATVGTVTGSVSVTSSSEAVETPSVSLPVSVQVIRGSSPSLSPTTVTTTASLTKIGRAHV